MSVARRRLHAMVRSGGLDVRVCLRSGLLRSQQPKLQFDAMPSTKPSTIPSALDHITLEDSVWMIERALDEGRLASTPGLRLGLERLQEQLEEIQILASN